MSAKKINNISLQSIGINLVIPSYIDYLGDVQIESPVFCASTIRFDTFIRIGAFSNLNVNSQIGHTSIGRYCSIAQNCFIGGDKHPSDWLSTSRLFYQADFKNFSRFHEGKKIQHKNFNNTGLPVVIGNDVLITNSCIVSRGVQIGNGAILAPGSIVIHDVPAYAIVGGNPAKVIKYRFERDVIDELEKLAWWRYNMLDFPDLSFDNVYKFIDQFKIRQKDVDFFNPITVSRDNFSNFF